MSKGLLREVGEYRNDTTIAMMAVLKRQYYNYRGIAATTVPLTSSMEFSRNLLYIKAKARFNRLLCSGLIPCSLEIRTLFKLDEHMQFDSKLADAGGSNHNGTRSKLLVDQIVTEETGIRARQ